MKPKLNKEICKTCPDRIWLHKHHRVRDSFEEDWEKRAQLLCPVLGGNFDRCWLSWETFNKCSRQLEHVVQLLERDGLHQKGRR